jgi:hypothetical protein
MLLVAVYGRFKVDQDHKTIGHARRLQNSKLSYRAEFNLKLIEKKI